MKLVTYTEKYSNRELHIGGMGLLGLSYAISPPYINLPYFGKKKIEKKEKKQGVVVGPFKIRSSLCPVEVSTRHVELWTRVHSWTQAVSFKIRLKTHNFMLVTRFSLF